MVFTLIAINLQIGYVNLTEIASELFDPLFSLVNVSPLDESISPPDVEHASSEFMGNLNELTIETINYGSDLRGALLCYLAGLTCLIISTREKINLFYKSSFDFFFGP